MSVCSSAYALTRQYVDEASTIQHPIITFAPTYLHSAEDNYDNEIQLLGVDFKVSAIVTPEWNIPRLVLNAWNGAGYDLIYGAFTL